MTELVVSAKLTLDNKGYVTGIQQAESETQRLNAGAKALAESLVAAASSRAKDAAAWAETTRNTADLSAQYRRQAQVLAERDAAAAQFIAGLKREQETMGLSRAEMVRYEARQLALTEGQKRLAEQFARRLESPKLQTIDQQAVEAATRAVQTLNKENAQAARAALVLEKAEAQLNAELAKGNINQAQHAAALGRVRTELDQTGGAANNAAGRTSELSNAVGAVGRMALGLVALQQIGQYAAGALRLTEGYQRLEAQLKLTSDTSYQLRQSQDAVVGIAQRTYVPLNELGTLWGRLAPVMREAGYAQAQVADVSEVVAKSLRLSNAGAAESASTMLQFSQSMASGVMRGEEFNSLMENSPVLMRKLAEGLGVPVGALRKMAEEGELTSEKVVAALLKTKDSIDRDFAKLPQTVSASWQKLTNNVQVSMGEMDKSLGVTKTMAEGINGLANNLGTVTTALGLVTTAFGAARVASLALAWTPMGLAIMGVSAAAIGLAKGMELLTAREKERQALQSKAIDAMAEENRLQKDINAARLKMREIKAPPGYEEALVQINQAYRQGKMSAKEAEAATNAYLEAATSGAAKLARAKTNFEQFLPNAKKVKAALDELDGEYKAMQEAGIADEAAYQARRTKIVEDAFKDQIKLQQDLLKDANDRQLTDEQKKVAAIVAEQKKRVDAAGANTQLIAAIERNAIQAVAQIVAEGERAKLLVSKKGAEDRLKATEDALAKSIALEKSYADQITGLQAGLAARRQETADRLRELTRKQMTDSAAEADRQAEAMEKLGQAEEELRKGNLEGADSLSKKAQAVAGLSQDLEFQQQVIRKSQELDDAATQSRIDGMEREMAAQQRKSADLRNQLEQDRLAVSQVTSAVESLDAKLASSRSLDIDTTAALNKINEVKNRLAEVANGMNLGSLGLGNGVSVGADGMVFTKELGSIIPGRAHGGRINGAGTETSDSILLWASNDEFMVRAYAARRIGYGVLDYINRYGEVPPGHATGGRIGQPAQGVGVGPSSAAGGGAVVAGGTSIVIEHLEVHGVQDLEGLMRELEDATRTRPLRINTASPGKRGG